MISKEELTKRLRPPEKRGFQIEDVFKLAELHEALPGNVYTVKIDGETQPRKKGFKAILSPAELQSGDRICLIKAYNTFLILGKIY